MTDHQNCSAESCDLKPCPFCGTKATIQRRMDEDLWTHNIVEWVGVHCDECGIYFEQPVTSDTTAADAWNKRACEIERERALITDVAQPSREPGKLGDPHPHWSEQAKNENYPKTLAEWDPHQDPVGEHLKRAVARLRVAMDHDDSRAPVEMAIISRWDLTTLVHDWWHKCAVFDLWRKERAEKEAAHNGLSAGTDHVLMPREATREMTMAACDYLPSCEHVFGHAGELLRNCYRKMVEVAGTEPQTVAWLPIETAPHEKRVLLGWHDWRDHQWCVEVGPATTGQRFGNGYSNLSQHGSATHWMPLPSPMSRPEHS